MMRRTLFSRGPGRPPYTRATSRTFVSTRLPQHASTWHRSLPPPGKSPRITQSERALTVVGPQVFSGGQSDRSPRPQNLRISDFRQRRCFARGVRFPTVAEAGEMPRGWNELDNLTLWVHCGPEGNHEANEERLIRELMHVKQIEYSKAVEELLMIQDHIIGGNNVFRHLGLLPYKVGMLSAAFLGLSTVPMIFHKQTVLWFNQNFVTADVPEPKDLETWLEVGSFAWNWMEPAIGQLSFMFLVAQYMRSQLLNLGLKPYTGMLINYRCSRAVERYPELSETILTDYATTISWEGRRK